MSLPERTDEIYYAIVQLEQAAERIGYLGGVDNYDRSKEMRRTASEAMRQYRQLSDAMPRLRALDAEAKRQYDRHVTHAPEPEGCSCHLNAPCSWCTRDTKGELDNA